MGTCPSAAVRRVDARWVRCSAFGLPPLMRQQCQAVILGPVGIDAGPLSTAVDPLSGSAATI